MMPGALPATAGMVASGGQFDATPPSFHSNFGIQPPRPEGPRVPIQYYIPPGYYPPQFYPQHNFVYPSHQVLPYLNVLGMM